MRQGRAGTASLPVPWGGEHVLGLVFRKRARRREIAIERDRDSEREMWMNREAFPYWGRYVNLCYSKKCPGTAARYGRFVDASECRQESPNRVHLEFVCLGGGVGTNLSGCSSLTRRVLLRPITREDLPRFINHIWYFPRLRPTRF